MSLKASPISKDLEDDLKEADSLLSDPVKKKKPEKEEIGAQKILLLQERNFCKETYSYGEEKINRCEAED